MTEKTSDYVIPDNVSRTIGRDAQRNNIMAAKIVADIVKTTLGPKGMDKMLVDSTGNVIVTNDGVTILEEMEIEHPAAKMMVDIAKTQELEVGDGTTSAVLIAGKLLENAETLLDKKIHPTIIIKGYEKASKKALEILSEISIPIKERSILKKIAMTAMTGKGAEGNREKLSEIIVEAVSQISDNTINSSDIKIEKVKGNSVVDSELIKGIVLDKERANQEMPSRIEKAKILLIDFPIEFKGPESETRISVSSPEQLQSFIKSEEMQLKMIVEKIIGTGARVVFCQKGIDDVAQYYFEKAGIMACRRIPKSDMERLSKATSGKIISSQEDLSDKILGSAELVEEIKENDTNLIYVKGCVNPKAVSIIIRGGTSHVLDEIERAIKDGLGDVISAIKSGRIVAGGGAVEIEISRRIRFLDKKIEGREQLAIEQFALALESIPETLAENAGLDPIDIMTELKKRHESGLINDGLNLLNGQIEDSFLSGIIEPIKVKQQAITSASEVAMMILRIDDVLISKGKGQGFNPSLGSEYE